MTRRRRLNPTTIALFCAVLLLGFALGCGRTVLVREGSPMRIGPAAKGRIYTRQGGEWILSDDRVAIPEGWYLVPPSFVEEEP